MKYPVGKTEAEGDFDKFHAEREEMRKRLAGRQLHAKDHFQPDKVPVDQGPLEVVNFGRVPGSKRIRRLWPESEKEHKIADQHRSPDRASCSGGS